MNIVSAPFPAHIATLSLIGTSFVCEPTALQSKALESAQVLPLAQNSLVLLQDDPGVRLWTGISKLASENHALVLESCAAGSKALATTPSAFGSLAKYLEGSQALREPDIERHREQQRASLTGFFMAEGMLGAFFGVGAILSTSFPIGFVVACVSAPFLILCFTIRYGLQARKLSRPVFEGKTVPELLEIIKRRADKGEAMALKALLAAFDEGVTSTDDPATRAFTPAKLNPKVLIDYEMRERCYQVNRRIRGQVAVPDPVRDYIHERALTDREFNNKLNEALHAAWLQTIPFPTLYR